MPVAPVLTASSSVLAPAVRLAAYQTSKFAVMGFGETLREELAGEGIGVTILFPGGMTTRHLQSSADARPARLGPSVRRPEDLAAMLAHRPMADGDLVTPEHAIRNLLADLIADAPYSVTHGSWRPVYERAIFTAFSTASAPELKRALRFSKSPGVRRFSSSATRT